MCKEQTVKNCNKVARKKSKPSHSDPRRISPPGASANTTLATGLTNAPAEECMEAGGLSVWNETQEEWIPETEKAFQTFALSESRMT